MRARAHGDPRSSRAVARHFKIERLTDAGLEPGDVIVADVSAILAQVRG